MLVVPSVASVMEKLLAEPVSFPVTISLYAGLAEVPEFITVATTLAPLELMLFLMSSRLPVDATAMLYVPPMVMVPLADKGVVELLYDSVETDF